ncbi:MAG TPA: NUDIX domain-containing protein [Patescibacteria group bacterium]|nr:NUDIX domain-containing protein [Patescibacteria group bacterium]
MSRITVVDENDKVVGAEEREVVRQKGLIHRIARVFVINNDGRVLLQRRSLALQDNPGKWDQSVGGHVDEGEDYLTAAKRETLEELGISVDDFKELGKFYVERPAPGGTVRRFQTVFSCVWDGAVDYDKSEVNEVRWFSVTEIDDWVAKSPEDFTKNFARAFTLLKQSA